MAPMGSHEMGVNEKGLRGLVEGFDQAVVAFGIGVTGQAVGVDGLLVGARERTQARGVGQSYTDPVGDGRDKRPVS